MHLSPLAARLLALLDGSAPDATFWPVTSQLTTAMAGRPGDSAVVDQTWAEHGRASARARRLPAA
ncbi:hypothetical protein [Nonomuraea dietziae]|uniref:hypothetical protein n=1 Tax=Nonomuraea dietziae TaxID=65515 RepID=UPI0031D81CB5